MLCVNVDVRHIVHIHDEHRIASAAFAGVVLTRATLIAGSLLTGFMAYQHALKKYGQPKLDEVDFASASK